MTTDIILWSAWILGWFVLEAVGLFKPKNATTFTHYSCKLVPLWLRGAIIGWMFVHFCIQNEHVGTIWSH